MEEEVRDRGHGPEEQVTAQQPSSKAPHSQPQKRVAADVEGEEDERHSGPEKRLLGSV
jgi:hypothetical protein